MKTYSRFQIECIFDKVWDTWINKDGESAARKAVDVFLKSDNSEEDLLRSCEAYRLEALGTDPEFTYKLSNFLNQEHWRDVLESVNLEKLKARYNYALNIIDKWNAACKDHWCKALNPDTKVPIVTKAMGDAAFSKHWEEALKKAEKIFRKRLNDDDPRSKIILSLRWFVTITPEKHTVLRIMEGELGSVGSYDVVTKPTLKSRTPTLEEIDQALKDFREVFPDVKPLKKKIVVEKTYTDEQIESAEKLVKQFGIESEECSKISDTFEFFSSDGD